MCPFVNDADQRCSAHWTLGNVAEALSHCADHYSTCPVYQQLKMELSCCDIDETNLAAIKPMRAAC